MTPGEDVYPVPLPVPRQSSGDLVYVQDLTPRTLPVLRPEVLKSRLRNKKEQVTVGGVGRDWEFSWSFVVY